MPRLNGVTGTIVAIPKRGMVLGNCSVLHNDRRMLVRTAQVRRWICCVLSFKGIRGVVMKPRSYTELFFLDEVTAFAAGHRPCFECRRAAALAYQAAWVHVFGGPAMANDMDLVLDAERRVARTNEKRTYEADARDLPDGTIVAHAGNASLVLGGRLRLWTPAGYTISMRIGAGVVAVLKPRSTTEVLRAGYAPGIHSSATSRLRDSSQR